LSGPTVRSVTALAFGTVALTACGVSLYGTTPYRPVPGPTPISRGTASDFTAVVPPADGAVRCEARDAASTIASGRMVTLVREGPPVQRITVTIDPEGEPVRYVDDRGDLSSGRDRGGDRTTIALYLTEGYAVAANRSGSDVSVVEIPLEEAVDSPNLGRPSDQLERVLARCASQELP